MYFLWKIVYYLSRVDKGAFYSIIAFLLDSENADIHYICKYVFTAFITD